MLLRPMIKIQLRNSIYRLGGKLSSIPKPNSIPNIDVLSKENKVPVYKISRLASYGGIALKILMDSVQGNEKLSKKTINEIVEVLCKLRGASLKFGQFLSIQDSTVISEEVREIFDRVRQHADYMPWYQTNSVLSKSFGKNWRNEFLSFETKPIAAASIGQVHRAVTLDKNEVAVKIQYPGVADSMLNDLQILSFFLTTLKLLPKSYFLENTINEMSDELSLETDYIREANNQETFRKLFQDHPFIEIPKVYSEYSSPTILTSQYIYGMPIDYCTNLSQDTRDKIGHYCMMLTLQELFQFKFMQTDPNWSNFFYSLENDKLYLLDFGSCRAFAEDFVETYIKIIYGASKGDRFQVESYSKELGFLTGCEDKIMTEAHIESVMILAEPFRREGLYDFADQTITKRIGKLVPTMLEHRMTAPPKDTYSLHRKMSGIFLLCAKLKSKIYCKELFENACKKYDKNILI